MKKLAIVALVLVAMSFVGCGMPSELIGTWERTWNNGKSAESWEFKSNNEVVYSYSVNGAVSDTITYDCVVDGDIITLSVLDVDMFEFRYEVNGDELSLYWSTSNALQGKYKKK